MRILVTGATGFVGSQLTDALLLKTDVFLTLLVRRQINDLLHVPQVIGELCIEADWQYALIGHHVVIHAAARAHIMSDEVVDPLAEYRRINVAGTLSLARQAAAAGVKRFIFISSIKVNGESTLPPSRFKASDAPAPEDAYGLSKLEAEQGLMRLGAETGMEVVIIRPPLVYGPGVKGNFASMIKLVQKGLPVPLGAIHNKRTLVSVDNLVDLIIHCIDHPAAANQVLLVGDGQDLSTTMLLRAVAKAMGRPSRLIPVSANWLQWGAALLGKQAMAQRLLGSLQVDISDTCCRLNWLPPYTLEQGLQRMFKGVDV